MFTDIDHIVVLDTDSNTIKQQSRKSMNGYEDENVLEKLDNRRKVPTNTAQTVTVDLPCDCIQEEVNKENVGKCVICQYSFRKTEILPKCQHTFHKTCFDTCKWLKIKKTCPKCQLPLGWL